MTDACGLARKNQRSIGFALTFLLNFLCQDKKWKKRIYQKCTTCISLWDPSSSVRDDKESSVRDDKVQKGLRITKRFLYLGWGCQLESHSFYNK
jgi:hypothetical protein